jgi:DNA-binding transcriptional LysR family regulator
VTPDVLHLLFAPVLKGFLAAVGNRNVNVTQREARPSTLRRLVASRRIDIALQGVMIDDEGAVQMEGRTSGLQARRVGKPFSPVVVARPAMFRGKTGELESLDALAAEVKTLCIQRIDYRDLQLMGKLPRARRWVRTDTQAGSVTMAEAGLGAALTWEVPGLYQQLGLLVRPIRNSILPRTQLAVWVNADDEARRRQAAARENPRWDPVLTFLDSLPGPEV